MARRKNEKRVRSNGKPSSLIAPHKQANLDGREENKPPLEGQTILPFPENPAIETFSDNPQTLTKQTLTSRKKNRKALRAIKQANLGGPRKSKRSFRPIRAWRNWLELPEDVTASILSRVGAIEILSSVQMVCVTWRNICKDPLMWRTTNNIVLRNPGNLRRLRYRKEDLENMCRRAIDRTANLVDVTVENMNFCIFELLDYITARSSGIRHLRLVRCNVIMSHEQVINLASKLPMLEDLEISSCKLSSEALEVIGRSCPLLKSLKLNKAFLKSRHRDRDAVPIAQTMQGLRHLQLIRNNLSDHGLWKILDCCPYLESLDLRHCFNLDLEGDLRIICAQQIEKLQLPYDSVEDYEFVDTFVDYESDSSYCSCCCSYKDYDPDDLQFSNGCDFYGDFSNLRLSDDFFLK